MLTFIRALLVLAFITPLSQAGNWPAWRGPNRNGHSPEKEAPLQWDKTKNVLWKIALPDEGNSTPIVWDDRIFLTQATDKGRTRALFCLSRKDGKTIWKKEVIHREKESTHRTNPFCSASPVIDGERVIVSFGSAGMHCYDFDGKKQWSVDVGKLEHIWGNASSPILYKDLAILWCGPGERQFLLAVDKKSGEEKWRYKVPGGASGLGNGKRNWVGSWSTPIVANVNGRDELILSVPRFLKGIDPNKGTELWSCAGLGPLVYTSPIISKDNIVVACSGYGGAALAVKAGGNGDVTKNRLWHHTKRNPQRIGSGVVIGDYAYLRSDTGLTHRFDLKTGEDTWKERAGRGKGWGSAVVVGDRIYVSTERGGTVVLAVGPKFKVLATNNIGELMRSSPVIADGQILLRTYKHLWCIGERSD